MLFDELEDGEDGLFDEPTTSKGQDFPSEPDTIPDARHTSHLMGHQDIEQQLLSMLEHQRFPHGLIFSGMEGIGKSVMAYRLARYLFAKKSGSDDNFSLFGAPPDRDTTLQIASSDPIFSRVASGGNADLLVIERPLDEKTGLLKASVPVEEIRKIAPFMRRTASTDGGWRIVIVDDADTMTRSSQNSLLKILEEPPEKSLLILIAHRAGALLPTIFSRCVHIPFLPLQDDVIQTALKGRCPSDKLPLILSMAEGSLGAAYRYAEPHNLDLISQTIALLNDGGKMSWHSIQTFADYFGNKGNEEAQRIFRETLLWAASGLVRGKIAGFEPLKQMSLERRLKIYDDLKAHFDRCQIGNLDKRFLILGAYTTFE